MAFSRAMQAAVTRTDHCYRAYLKVTACNGEVLYFRSHDDVLTPAESTSTAGIESIAATSQSVDFDTYTSSIGNMSFRVLDYDSMFTRWMKSLNSCGLNGATVQYFAGYDNVPFCDYHCVDTQIIEQVSTKYKGYTFTARDIAKQGRTQIFTEDCAKHFGRVYDTSVAAIPNDNFEANRAHNLQIDEGGELWIIQDEPWTNSPNRSIFPGSGQEELVTDECTYIKCDCDIMRVCIVGDFSFDAIPPTRDALQNIVDEGRAAISGFRYQIMSQGNFGSKVKEVGEDGLLVQDNIDICHAMILRGPAPWVLYAVLTGCDYDTGEQILQPANHVGISKDFVNTDCMRRDIIPQFWQETLEFVCPKSIDGKAFWEEQILRWLGAFFTRNCDGQLCLQEAIAPDESESGARVIERQHIISCTDLTEDINIYTSVWYQWDYNLCEGEYDSTSTNFLSDGYVQQRCLQRQQNICRFDGVRSNFRNYQSIVNKMCNDLVRQSVPKWMTTLDLCVEHADLLPGDLVRIRNGLALDYNGESLTLDRVFIVTQVSPDFIQGTVSISVSTPSKPIDEGLVDLCTRQRPPCAGTAHCADMQNLNDLIPTGNIPAGEVVNIPAGDYCFTGDLNIEGTLRLSTPGQLGLSINGIITTTGLIDTTGMGQPGMLGSDLIAPITESPFCGSNQAQGGARASCSFNTDGDRILSCSCRPSIAPICSGQRLSNSITGVSDISQLRSLVLGGTGGCAGGGYGTNVPGTTSADGGDGGNGGGGLWIHANGFNLANNTIDTSGEDGQPGRSITPMQTTNNIISGAIPRGRSGAGAGGNTGGVVLVIDGGIPSSVNKAALISQRGRTPSVQSGCSSDSLGSSNANRFENKCLVFQLQCN